MPAHKKALPGLGNQYAKPDIERLGIFSEMPFSMIGFRYTSPFLIKPVQGKNMMCEDGKIKCGTDAGYFEKPFKRIFTGEGKGRQGAFKLAKDPYKPFIPPGIPKKHATPGDYFGTFSGNIEAFSRVTRPVPPYKREPRNCGSSKSRQGGPGYANICLNPYPAHSDERFGTKPKYKIYGKQLDGPMVTAHHTSAYFDKNPYKDPPNAKAGPTYVRPVEKKMRVIPPGKIIPNGPAKWQGGCHAGCFNKFPELKPDKYISLFDVMNPKKSKTDTPFYPQSMAVKTYYTQSVINENLSFRVNCNNYKTYKPVFAKFLLN